MSTSDSSAVSRRVSRPEDCKLYFVELEELLKNDTHVHQRCLESLASVSKGLITIDHLRLMAHNPRHQLYVLLGPTANWSNEHGLTMYCAIQVCIEGEIPDMPELAEHDFLREQVKDAFIVSALSSKSLKGARLVHILTSLDAPEQGYDLTSLNCLTRYFSGEMENEAMEVVPEIAGNIFTLLGRRRGESLHYLGVRFIPTLDEFLLWERFGFTQIYVGEFREEHVRCVMLKVLHDYEEKISGPDQECSLIALFRNFRRIFIKLLSRLKHLDVSFGLRVLKFNNEFIKEDAVAAKKLLSAMDASRVEAFIESPKQLYESINDLLRQIGEYYFGGSLPMELSETEKAVLFILGLQSKSFGDVEKQLNLVEDNILLLLKGIFEKLLEYYNTYSPEVIDG